MGTGIFASTARFYIQDHLYSPAALTDYSGNVLERCEYDAYGNPTIWNADFTTEKANSNYGNPYLFTGRRTDYLDSGSLKIQYNRNRYYDYYSGRFTTHDPLAVDVAPSGPEDAPTTVLQQFGLLNLYEYANSRPTSMVDAWGLWGANVHCTDTTRWATDRGLCFADWIGQWDNGVDKGLLESPVRSSVIATLLDLLGASSVSSAWLDHVAYWHFPGADVGQPVVPGGSLARREIDKGISSCNLKIFSKGLHQLQDSYSHRSGGQMPPWLDRVGHSRDRYDWYWEQVNNPEANPWVDRPRRVGAIRRIVCPACTNQEMLMLLRRYETIMSKDADSVVLNIFGNAYGETENATKEQMDKFRENCPCIKEGPFAGECVICQGLTKSED